MRAGGACGGEAVTQQHNSHVWTGQQTTTNSNSLTLFEVQMLSPNGDYVKREEGATNSRGCVCVKGGPGEVGRADIRRAVVWVEDATTGFAYKQT